MPSWVFMKHRGSTTTLAMKLQSMYTTIFPNFHVGSVGPAESSAVMGQRRLAYVPVADSSPPNTIFFGLQYGECGESFDFCLTAPFPARARLSGEYVNCSSWHYRVFPDGRSHS